MNRPNILVVFSDQLYRGALGCYGDPNISTPNIDALAAGGVRFANACSTYPICVPFRFTLMTGHYAHTRRVPGIEWRMSPAERTLADAFNEGDYHTMYVGKWHLYGGLGRSGFESAHSLGWHPVPREHQGRWQTWRGFELRNGPFDTCYFRDDDPTPIRIEGYQTDGLCDVAMAEIRSHRAKSDQPFCCVISVEPPHPPHEAPAALEQKWLARRVETPPNFLVQPTERMPLVNWNHADAARRDEWLRRLKIYYAMVENLDANVGRLTRFLHENSLADNTVVVFVSDHGELNGSHCLREKQFPYEESAGIPLIIAGPGVAKGKVLADPTCTEDLYPTLLGLARLPAQGGLYGMDLAPLARGEARTLDRAGVMLQFVAETRPNVTFCDGIWRGWRSERYKYTILGAGTGMTPWQLFDLQADPYELKNLVDEPAHRDTAAQLHRRLVERMRQVGDDAAVAPAFGCPAQYVRALS